MRRRSRSFDHDKAFLFQLAKRDLFQFRHPVLGGECDMDLYIHHGFEQKFTYRFDLHFGEKRKVNLSLAKRLELLARHHLDQIDLN